MTQQPRRLPPDERRRVQRPAAPGPAPVDPNAASYSAPYQPERPTPPGSARPRAARTGRTRFWFGFFTSFLLLGLASCGGLVLGTGLDRFDLADLQGNGAAWSPPQVTPTSTPGPTVAASANQSPNQAVAGVFAIGQQVRNITNSRVNIRQTPGHLGKADNDIVFQIQPGAAVSIIGGPAAANNLVWWQISYRAEDGRTVEGWAAEATGSGVQILGQ